MVKYHSNIMFLWRAKVLNHQNMPELLSDAGKSLHLTWQERKQSTLDKSPPGHMLYHFVSGNAKIVVLLKQVDTKR